MHYLIVDGEMSGTGIKNSVSGEDVNLASLGLSNELQASISEWVERYEATHRADLCDGVEIQELDRIGLQLASAVKDKLPGSKLQYLSAANMTRVGVPFL
jgi:hypothetical protein